MSPKNPPLVDKSKPRRIRLVEWSTGALDRSVANSFSKLSSSRSVLYLVPDLLQLPKALPSLRHAMNRLDCRPMPVLIEHATPMNIASRKLLFLCQGKEHIETWFSDSSLLYSCWFNTLLDGHYAFLAFVLDTSDFSCPNFYGNMIMKDVSEAQPIGHGIRFPITNKLNGRWTNWCWSSEDGFAQRVRRCWTPLGM